MTGEPTRLCEYDIRGVADRDLDGATVRALDAQVAGPAVVGRDPRIHSACSGH